MMRLTKIIATVGPASNNEKTLEKLIKAGVDVFRFNLSHGCKEDHKATLKSIRKISSKLKTEIGILFDLAGPKFRIGKMTAPIYLKKGQEFILTSRKVMGTKKEASINQNQLIADLFKKDKILIDEGRIELVVEAKTKTDLVCRVQQGGTLSSNKGINVHAKVSVKPLTRKDYQDINFAIEEKIDWLALSFVREANDVSLLKKYLKNKKADILVMAKIEKRAAVKNISAIIKAADGIMVARGDLGVELPVEDVPLIQKKVITESMRRGKPVVTATQMLESMIENPRPTRAEVNDIANAIFDQTDAVMLSGETAVGKYPLLAVKTMVKVAGKVETAIDYGKLLAEKAEWVGKDTTNALSLASCEIVNDLGAALLVTSTQSGRTAIRSAGYRCPVPILAVTPEQKVVTKLKLVFGVVSILIKTSEDINDMFAKAKEAAISSSLVKKKDKIVITAGALVNVPGTTNLIKVDVI